MREHVLDPTGASDQSVDTTLTPRLRSLRGLTAGLLIHETISAAVVLSPEHARLFNAAGWAKSRHTAVPV